MWSVNLHLFSKCLSDRLVTAICRFSHRETNFLVPIFLSEHSSNPPHPQVTPVWPFLTTWDGSDQLMRARDWSMIRTQIYDYCDQTNRWPSIHDHYVFFTMWPVHLFSKSEWPSCNCDLSVLTPWNEFSSPHFPVRTFFEPSTSSSHPGVAFLDDLRWVGSANASAWVVDDSDTNLWLLRPDQQMTINSWSLWVLKLPRHRNFISGVFSEKWWRKYAKIIVWIPNLNF